MGTKVEVRRQPLNFWVHAQVVRFSRSAVSAFVITREGGRSSIPETLAINREAAAYWIPRFRGV
jgi:hypothetical protein